MDYLSIPYCPSVTGSNHSLEPSLPGTILIYYSFLLLLRFSQIFCCDGMCLFDHFLRCPGKDNLTAGSTAIRSDISRSFFADSSYMLSFSVLCSCVCSRLISPSVSSWHKQDNTLMHQSPGHIQRRTPYNF